MKRKKIKKDYSYYKKLPRGRFECWIDLHNHKFELVRTIGNVFSGIGGLLAILRIFNLI